MTAAKAGQKWRESHGIINGTPKTVEISTRTPRVPKTPNLHRVVAGGRDPAPPHSRYEVAGTIDEVVRTFTAWKTWQRVGVGWRGGYDGTGRSGRRGDSRNRET